MTKISCFGKSELLCNNNRIGLYMDVFSGTFIVKIHWFHLMEDFRGRGNSKQEEWPQLKRLRTLLRTI